MRLLNIGGTAVNIDAIDYIKNETAASLAGDSYIKFRSGETVSVAGMTVDALIELINSVHQ